MVSVRFSGIWDRRLQVCQYMFANRFPHWNTGYYKTGSHTGDTIIIVRVAVLYDVTSELGLRVPVLEDQQLQYGFPYCRHSL